MMGFFALNYWAVLAAAVARTIIGGLWYGPIFGKQWRHRMMVTPEDTRSIPLAPTRAMLGEFVASLIMAFVIAQLVFALGILDLGEGALLAFWLWLGLITTTYADGILWEGRPFKLSILNAAYSLVTLVVMTLILAWWL
jgi:hypothetical protein